MESVRPDPDALATPAIHPRIRTFHARHGRVTPTLRHLADHGTGSRDPSNRRPGRPLVVEIGCGRGDAALAYAAAHPDHDVVALDVHLPGIGNLVRGLDSAEVPNLWTACADAVDWMDTTVAPGELSAVHVFFPDPWPKARHHKRRLIRPDIAELLASRLAPAGTIRFASDHPGYAEQASRVLGDRPELVGGACERPAWRPVTAYEARARTAGRAVVELEYVRR